jgi:hypothetical protein
MPAAALSARLAFTFSALARRSAARLAMTTGSSEAFWANLATCCRAVSFARCMAVLCADARGVFRSPIGSCAVAGAGGPAVADWVGPGVTVAPAVTLLIFWRASWIFPLVRSMAWWHAEVNRETILRAGGGTRSITDRQTQTDRQAEDGGILKE